MRKCSIDNCNNFCGYSSLYICDKCNSAFLEGRLSFGKSSKQRKLKITSINQRGKIKRTVEKPKITSINESGSIKRTVEKPKKKCKIENCENYCDKSSGYICDICYEGYLAGRLSFREYSKIRKHREFDYPVEKEFNETAESMPGLWTLFSYILFAVLLFYAMLIIIGRVSDWIFHDSVAWFQSEPVQSFYNFINLDTWKLLAILYIRSLQIIALISIKWCIDYIIEGHVLAGVISIIVILYISLIGYYWANGIIEYLIYGN